MSDTVYTGRDPACGHVVAVMVYQSDRHPMADPAGWRKEVATEVAEWIRGGLTVELVTLQAFKDEGLCPCDRHAKREAAAQQTELAILGSVG